MEFLLKLHPYLLVNVLITRADLEFYFLVL